MRREEKLGLNGVVISEQELADAAAMIHEGWTLGRRDVFNIGVRYLAGLINCGSVTNSFSPSEGPEVITLKPEGTTPLGTAYLMPGVPAFGTPESGSR